MKVTKPDIITKETKVIELGQLEDRLVTLKDNLIEKNKRSNNSLLSGYWIMLDNELYYFKISPFTQGYINELLGEKISLEFGLETIHNQLASGIIKTNGKEVEIYGLLSKWARKSDYSYHLLKYVVNKKLLLNTVQNKGPKSFDSSNLSILECIDQMYPGQPICEQIRNFITRDFFTQEKDRLESELLIATKDDKTELGFLSDYEYEWLDINDKYFLSGFLFLDLSNQQTICQIQQDPFFQASFTKALEINVMYLLEQIKEEYKIRLIDYDKNNYKEKVHKMQRIIKEKGLVK